MKSPNIRTFLVHEPNCFSVALTCKFCLVNHRFFADDTFVHSLFSRTAELTARRCQHELKSFFCFCPELFLCQICWLCESEKRRVERVQHRGRRERRRRRRGRRHRGQSLKMCFQLLQRMLQKLGKGFCGFPIKISQDCLHNTNEKNQIPADFVLCKGKDHKHHSFQIEWLTQQQIVSLVHNHESRPLVQKFDNF